MIRSSVLRIVFHVKVKCQGHTDVKTQQAVAVGADSTLTAVSVAERRAHCVGVAGLPSEKLAVVQSALVACHNSATRKYI